MENLLVKSIVFFTLLQLLVLATLAHRVFLVEHQLDKITSQTRQQSAMVMSQPVENTVSSIPDGFNLKEDELRRIIRSEIRSELNLFADSLVEAPSESQEHETTVDPAENARRLQSVKQELSSYIERGEISDSEMQAFQMAISRLDPESHKLMLRELVRALNSGDLKGRL